MDMDVQRMELDQGTVSWDLHRALHRNASEAGCIMHVSPFDPDTWAKLWALKTGRALKTPATAAMLRGLEYEKEALVCYEALTGNIMQSQVFTRGQYSASLDGINLLGDIEVEIKCPYRGKESLLWQKAEAGIVPPHYYWQIQHQLYVSKAEVAHFFVYDGAGEGLLLEVLPNEDDIAYLCAQWDRFWVHIEEDREPELSGKDYVIRQDRVWTAAAEEYKTAAEALARAEARAKQAKRTLLGLDQRDRVSGGGVSITRSVRQGPVDYSRIPELEKVDLDLYRKPDVEQIRVTLDDANKAGR